MLQRGCRTGSGPFHPARRTPAWYALAVLLPPVLYVMAGWSYGAAGWTHGTAGSAVEPAAKPLSLQRDEPALACGACHDASDGFVRSPPHFLNRRAELGREAWADSVRLEAKCGSCHAVPDPAELPADRWGDAVITFMSKVIYYRGRARGFGVPPDSLPYPEWMNRTRDEWMDVLHYYLTFSGPGRALPPDPPAAAGFEGTAIGHPPERLPQIGNVNAVDLDRDGRIDVVVSDFSRHQVSVIQHDEHGWTEHELATVPFPGHTEVGDFDEDGVLDIIVADVGSNVPTDDRVGSVVLLTGRGGLDFDARILLKDVGRVADARPGDFDGDGDTDFVVAIFGFLKAGGIGWIEQADGSYRFHRLSDKAGGVNVLPLDLNGDGRLDFIALISQQHEEVTAFLNEGGGRFAEHVLFKAESPTFGSSGIEPVDLDGDGDVDLLYTNGDAFDLSTPMVRPYHGVQWLENRGDLEFEYHDLIRLYGAYRAVAGDFDADGDLDIAATSLINDWRDPTRRSLVWLENDGTQAFTARGIEGAPTAIITADVADFDGDGRDDLVTGSMHMSLSDPRRGRVVLWTSLGPGGD